MKAVNGHKPSFPMRSKYARRAPTNGRFPATSLNLSLARPGHERALEDDRFWVPQAVCEVRSLDLRLSLNLWMRMAFVAKPPKLWSPDPGGLLIHVARRTDRGGGIHVTAAVPAGEGQPCASVLDVAV